MEVYIPKQEKRAPDNETQPERKQKGKTQSLEPTFAIEAPPPKPKTKARQITSPENDLESK